MPRLEVLPVKRWTNLMRATVSILAILNSAARGAQFMPPAGYGGSPAIARPGVARPPEAGSPSLTRIPDSQLSSLFRSNRQYQRAHVKVVGAFRIVEPNGTRLLDAWSPGFLPVWLSFSDGRCFQLTADYDGGTLSNGRLRHASCENKNVFIGEPPPRPNDPSQRLLNASWGYGAWTNPKTGIVTVTVPYQKAFVPLFTTRMKVGAMMAMNSPDAPLGNVTLVGKIKGALTVVTLEVAY